MGIAAFRLAVLWENTFSAGSVERLVESLERRFGSKVSNVVVTLTEERACLQFSVDFSLYTRRTLSEVDTDVQKSGGRLVELLRLPEDKRQEFNAKFLHPTRGAPLTLNHLSDCARPIQHHLTKLASMPKDQVLVTPPSGITRLPVITPPFGVRQPTSQPSNRRHELRFGCTLQVQMQNGSGLVHGLATNISQGGIFVCTSQHALKPELTLKVQLPNGRLLQTTARVAHVVDNRAPGGVGLAFDPADAVIARELERCFSPDSASDDRRKRAVPCL
jgi:Tfp pilus assembly protein PilZ